MFNKAEEARNGGDEREEALRLVGAVSSIESNPSSEEGEEVQQLIEFLLMFFFFSALRVPTSDLDLCLTFSR